MTKSFFLLFFSISFLGLAAQSADQDSLRKDLSTMENEIIRWIADIYTFGVAESKDSLVISAEVIDIMQNDTLRQFMYPDTYAWSGALYLMNQMELKKAFWYFINLYQIPENQELVMKSVLTYDRIMEMDVALLSSFYTYAMLDPRVADISPEGQVTVRRPDLIESKLKTVRDMIDYIHYYREVVEQK